jgi:hypothetical protein
LRCSFERTLATRREEENFAALLEGERREERRGWKVRIVNLLVKISSTIR